MKSAKNYLILLFFTFAPYFLCAQTSAVSSALAPFLDAMIADFYKPSVTVGMGSLTYAETLLPTPFARWFEGELRQALTKTDKLKFFDKQVAAAMDPSIREKYVEFFGNGIVDSLMYGEYIVDGEFVKVTISLTDLSTGQLISEKILAVPTSSLPLGIKVEPSLQTVQTAQSLMSLAKDSAADDPGFTISMSADRGIGAVYASGENLTLMITCSRDAYLKIYHVDGNGVAQLIWPNRFGGSGKITKGEAFRFPAEGDLFKYKLGAPYGTEYVKAIASVTPFLTMEPDFSDLNGAAAAAITRGLSLVSTNASNRAEALVVYEIVP